MNTSATSMDPRMTPSAVSKDIGDPIWFGNPERALLGWLHTGSAAPRSAGVVLCAPFGHEYLVAYRAYRKLAARLVEDGFTVLRFDYDGTGDSAGAGWDGQRVSSWQQSITAAIGEIKECTGLQQVVLFGLRLGALLAASVAKEAGADSLVMVAPILSGRLYVRELLAFRNMNAVSSGAPARGGDEEVTGYSLTNETRSSLATLDLPKMPGPLAKQVLIIARDDLPSGEQRLVDTLIGRGESVDLQQIPGYGALMKDDAYDAVVPQEIWEAVAKWLVGRYPLYSQTPIQRGTERRRMAFKVGDLELREEVIDVHGATGVVTEPISGPSPTRRPAIIISNTGANHRVGNHRLCVTMARNWAARGYCVVRYDRPGIGDSSVSPGGRENDVYAMIGVDSLRSVMDYLRDSRGHHHFILAGLCSGAYFSYHAALVDTRAVGLLMINPLTYHWKEGDSLARTKRTIYKSTDFYRRSALSRETWTRLLKGQINLRGIAGALSSRAATATMSKWRHALTWALQHESAVSAVGQSFIALETRGTEILMIFDADEGGIDLMEEHLRPNAALLRKSSRFRLEIINGTDHTFTPLWAQTYISDLIGDHWQRRFG